MPELPEVETVARTLLPHVKDAIFTESRLLHSSALHPASLPLAAIQGMRISRVWRRGKLLLFDLMPTASHKHSVVPQYLVAHLRMTGRIFTAQANMEQGKHTRCVFALETPVGQSFQLFFDDIRTFGKILAATDDILRAWPFWRDLGPEPLPMHGDEFQQRLQSARQIKSVLLDQKVIAGIGNIYADESLFYARINPSRPAVSLTFKEASRLLAALQRVLEKAIANRGSSIRDYRDADGNTGDFQKNFAVYGRGGKKCVQCGGVLQKCKIGGRGTVYCPHCQN